MSAVRLFCCSVTHVSGDPFAIRRVFACPLGTLNSQWRISGNRHPYTMQVIEFISRGNPSHGRGRRFNPYSAHQHINELAPSVRLSPMIGPRNTPIKSPYGRFGAIHDMRDRPVADFAIRRMLTVKQGVDRRSLEMGATPPCHEGVWVAGPAIFLQEWRRDGRQPPAYRQPYRTVQAFTLFLISS